MVMIIIIAIVIVIIIIIIIIPTYYLVGAFSVVEGVFETCGCLNPAIAIAHHVLICSASSTPQPIHIPNKTNQLPYFSHGVQPRNAHHGSLPPRLCHHLSRGRFALWLRSSSAGGAAQWLPRASPTVALSAGAAGADAVRATLPVPRQGL